MTFVIRFIGRNRFIREYFLNMVHIKDTIALTLKEQISSVLSHHNLDIQNIRGQWYDNILISLILIPVNIKLKTLFV
jgi:hypothetical protein